MDIKFTMNGKRINPKNFGKELEKQFKSEIPNIAKDHVVNDAKQKIRNLKCSDHGQGITRVWASRMRGTKFTLKFEGCCDKLLVAAQNLISQN